MQGMTHRQTDENRLKVLFVEDSEDIRWLIKKIFIKTSIAVVDFAENGEIAVEKFRNGRFDLVLMDMQMPVMDGYTAAKEMRRWEEENGEGTIPIFAITGFSLEKEVRKCLAAGCTGHITKPLSRMSLLKIISQYTGQDRNRADSANL